MLLPPPLFLSLYYYLKYVLSLSLSLISLFMYISIGVGEEGCWGEGRGWASKLKVKSASRHVSREEKETL
jgi:hypothetical protein